jgi:hypothetical protein
MAEDVEENAVTHNHELEYKVCLGFRQGLGLLVGTGQE